MMMPKKAKHRKAFKGRIKGLARRGQTIVYGRYGLQSQSAERVNARQIEAARVAMTRYIKRGGRVWIRIFPHLPVSRKGVGLKMGGGKGNPEFHACRVKPGTILFEMDGVSQAIARQALLLAASKLPVKTKFLIKGEL